MSRMTRREQQILFAVCLYIILLFSFFSRGGIIIDQGAGGTGTIWLDKVECKEHDRYLHHCEHKPYGVHNCDHTEDVWVECESRFRQTESRGKYLLTCYIAKPTRRFIS